MLAQHDWVHVLADYGSTVESEIEVFAFIARANDDPRAFSLLAQIIALFETGHVASGLGMFEYDRGHLSHEGMAVRLADAMRRGALSAAANHSIDFLTVDWFDARRRRTSTKCASASASSRRSERAVVLGSVTPWEPGGMTPFQFEAGRRRAERERRRFETFGATPRRRPRRSAHVNRTSGAAEVAEDGDQQRVDDVGALPLHEVTGARHHERSDAIGERGLGRPG